MDGGTEDPGMGGWETVNPGMDGWRNHESPSPEMQQSRPGLGRAPLCRVRCPSARAGCGDAGVVAADLWAAAGSACPEQRSRACFPIRRRSDAWFGQRAVCWCEAEPRVSVEGGFCCAVERRLRSMGSSALAPNTTWWFLVRWPWTGELKLSGAEACSSPCPVCPAPFPCPGWSDFSGRILLLSLFKARRVFWVYFSDALFGNSREAACSWRSPESGGGRCLPFGACWYCWVPFSLTLS